LNLVYNCREELWIKLSGRVSCAETVQSMQARRTDVNRDDDDDDDFDMPHVTYVVYCCY